MRYPHVRFVNLFLEYFLFSWNFQPFAADSICQQYCERFGHIKLFYIPKNPELYIK